MNPFHVPRHQLTAQTQLLKECILTGQSHWPHPPPSSASMAMIGTAVGASATATVDDDSIHSFDPFDEKFQNEIILRPPCFYNLFPETWRRQKRSTHETESNPRSTARAREEDVEMSDADPSTATVAAVSASTPTSAMIPNAAPPLRLRPRSPSRILLSGTFSRASARALYEWDYTNELIAHTAHVTGHVPNSNNDLPLNPLTMPDQTTVTPAASVHYRHSRFNKPVADMGDYASLMRATLLLRNPYADPLDDPQFVAHIANQHSLAAAIAARDRNDDLVNSSNNGGGGGGGGGVPSTPIANGAGSGVTNRAHRRFANGGGSASSGSTSAPSSPTPRLTVDEADDLTDSGSPSSSSPMSPHLIRNRRLLGSGLRSRLRTPKPSFAQFVAIRTGYTIPPTEIGAIQQTNNSNNNLNNTNNTSSTIDTNKDPSSSSFPSDSSSSNSRSSSPTPLPPRSSTPPPPPTSSSKPDPKLLKNARAIEDASKALHEARHGRGGGQPNIATLLASMTTQRTKKKDTSPPVKESNLSSPAVLATLYRMECDLGTTLKRVVRQTSAAAFPVYLARVEAWFGRELLEVLRLGRETIDIIGPRYEAVFNRWHAELLQLLHVTAKSPTGLAIRWTKIWNEAMQKRKQQQSQQQQQQQQQGQ